MIVSAKDYTSGSECRAAARALHAKFYPPVQKAKPVVKTVEVAETVERKATVFRWVPPKPIPVKRAPVNMWEKANLTFNAHVVDYRAYLLRMEQSAAGEIADDVIPAERKPVIEIVLEVLENFPGITVDDLKSSRRAQRFSNPRQVAMFEVYRQRIDMSFPRIGRWFGGRDHTTVLWAVRKIEAMRGEA